MVHVKLIMKKCFHCGSIVKIIQSNPSDDSNIICCERLMNDVIPNSVVTSSKNHIPNYQILGNKIKVTVNHVMEEDHHIEWISMIDHKKEVMIYLNSKDCVEVEFDYKKGSILYAYCNQHGLWKKEVK